MKSNYQKDFKKEQKLGEFLDNIYPKIDFGTYEIKRVTDINQQHKGIDLILFNNSKSIKIDEKAQLDFLNKMLPTFAFELSYLKDGSWRKGWLFDTKKETEAYFLINSIMFRNNEFHNVKIYAIYRDKLLKYIENNILPESEIYFLERNIREDLEVENKIPIKGICDSIGYLYYSKKIYEKPINLVLKLDNLVKNKLAKIIHPT